MERSFPRNTSNPISLSFTPPISTFFERSNSSPPRCIIQSPNSIHSPSKFLHLTRPLHPPPSHPPTTSFFHTTFFERRSRCSKPVPVYRGTTQRAERSFIAIYLSSSRKWRRREAERRKVASEAANTGAEARLYARCTSGDQSEIRLGSAVGEHNDRKTDRGRRTPLSLPSLLSSYRPYLFLSLSLFVSLPLLFFILVPNILSLILTR